jgi:hypothetical protein
MENKYKEITDDEWFDELKRQRRIEWNKIVKEHIKEDAQKKYLE